VPTDNSSSRDQHD